MCAVVLDAAVGFAAFFLFFVSQDYFGVPGIANTTGVPNGVVPTSPIAVLFVQVGRAPAPLAAFGRRLPRMSGNTVTMCNHRFRFACAQNYNMPATLPNEKGFAYYSAQYVSNIRPGMVP